MGISKNELRKEARIHMLSPKDAERTIQYIIDFQLFRDARNICIYKSIEGEIPTDRIIEEAWRSGKGVFIPHIDWEQKTMHMCKYTSESILKVERFGLVAPAICNPAEKVDLAIVPCRMVAKDGTRLGTGGGYYDRFFAQVSIPIRIGISRYPVVLDTLPTESHDVRMTHVGTVEGVVEVS